jgi:hypothetical protein
LGYIFQVNMHLRKVFAVVLISRINSWVSWFIFNPQKNKQVSHAPNTQNRNSAYSVIQSYKQYYEFVVSHSYVLEQPVLAAPREWVHLCLTHGIDCPSFPRGVAMLPPPTLLAWLGLPWFLLLIYPFRAVPTITHTIFPIVITWGLIILHIHSIMGAWHFTHTHIWIMVLRIQIINPLKHIATPHPPMYGGKWGRTCVWNRTVSIVEDSRLFS